MSAGKFFPLLHDPEGYPLGAEVRRRAPALNEEFLSGDLHSTGKRLDSNIWQIQQCRLDKFVIKMLS